MKKIIALVLCLVLVTGVLTGCRKSMDLDTLVQKMDAAIADATHTAGKAALELDFQLKTAGMTMDMGLDAAVEMMMAMDMRCGWLDLDLSMDLLGERQEMDMEIYMNADGEDLVTYMFDGASGTWIQSREEGYLQQATQTAAVKFAEMPREQMTLAEEKQILNGRECYVLTVNLNGGDVQTMLDSNTLPIEDEEARELMKSLDWSKLSAVMTYHVDAETFLPLQMEAQIQGLGDVMNGLLGPLLGAEEGAEMELSIPLFQVSMTELTYSGVEVPAVPQAAIDNALEAGAVEEEDTINEPQPDGSYLLTMGADRAHIVLPEGYFDIEAAADYLAVLNEDGSCYLTYALVGDVALADMDAGVLSEVDWARENGFYKSHSEIAERDSWRTMSIIYNDDTSIWYAWRELGGSVLVMAAEVLGESYDLAELIATVQIPVE